MKYLQRDPLARPVISAATRNLAADRCRQCQPSFVFCTAFFVSFGPGLIGKSTFSF